MMPCSVVVSKATSDRCVNVRRNGLIEDYGERPVVLYAQLPRPTASLNSSVVRRGFRRPVEPCGDREIEPLWGNPSSRNAISPDKLSRLTNHPGDIAGARHRPMRSEERRVGNEWG